MKPDREEVLRMAGEAGGRRVVRDINTPNQLMHARCDFEALERFYALAYEAGARAEREECAKVCAIRSAERAFISDNLKGNKPIPVEAVVESGKSLEAAECADAIRARNATYAPAAS